MHVSNDSLEVNKAKGAELQGDKRTNLVKCY